MVFSSLTFICAFLPATVAAYFLFPVSSRNLVLVIASIVFYGWGDPVALAFLLTPLVIVNFSAGRSIGAATGARRRRLVVCAIALDLAVLIVFKYTNFLIDNANELLGFGGDFRLPNPKLSLPLGISFFTFHIISYLVDIYRGAVLPQQSFAAFTLYIVNFPQLIAGPIIRYRQISAQLDKRYVTLDDVDAGVARFVAGLAKKMLVANPIGSIVDTIFAIPASDLTPATAWLGAVCYALQIYFDFSGYSDMAIGLARIFGFRFPENFNYPYAATSIQDFWRRWHMTLSAWFRDYVYIPLGGNRFGAWATARNLWIVFLLTGIWHGASWNFVIWGLWHGLFLWIERLGPLHRALSRMPKALACGYTMMIVLIGWVFFRASDLGYAMSFLSHMFALQSASDTAPTFGSLISAPMLVVAGVGVIFAYPLWPAIRTALLRRFAGDGAAAGLARMAYVAIVMVLSLATMAVGQQNPFLYFNF